jgi:hypothetical protein
LKIRSKRHPKSTRPHHELHATDTGPYGVGDDPAKPARKLKAASRRLERMAVIADIVNALADLLRL